MAHHPSNTVARNLTDPFDGFLLGKHYLILDRDSKLTAGFKDRLQAEGIRPVLIALQAPDMNAIAERWVLSARRECLDRMIFLRL